MSNQDPRPRTTGSIFESEYTPGRKYAHCASCNGTGRVPLSQSFAGICTQCWGTGTIILKYEQGSDHA